MSVQMIGRELDEIVRELYCSLQPISSPLGTSCTAGRAAGSREVAERLQQLRRPTRSAWLVNLLASDPGRCSACRRWVGSCAMPRPGSARTELRNLAEQRRSLIPDRWTGRADAEAAGIRPTPAVLSEVELTRQAALVDLAGALTICNGVRRDALEQPLRAAPGAIP